MMERIRKKLVEDEGYSLFAARRTARDLTEMTDGELTCAARRWLAGEALPDLSRGPFSCRGLMAHHGMKYPAALLFLDWYQQDPKTAVESLTCQGGDSRDL